MVAEHVSLLGAFRRFAEDLEKKSLWYTRLPEPLRVAFGASSPVMTEVIQPGKLTGYRARPHLPRCSPPRPMRPFRVEEMVNPPHGAARSSRLNTMGKSRLYLASRPEIAVVECRAVAGDFVTVCEFRLKRPAKFFDFRRLARCPDHEMRDLYAHISRSCGSPVDQSKGEAAEYLLTQWFAEYLQWELTFDGVIYATATYGKEDPTQQQGVERGQDAQEFNLCSFYPEQWTPVRDSLRILNVTGQNVVTREVEWGSSELRNQGGPCEFIRNAPSF